MRLRSVQHASQTSRPSLTLTYAPASGLVVQTPTGPIGHVPTQWTGGIDDVQVYQTALSAGQIDAITPTDACGAMPLRGFLVAAAEHGLEGRVLDLRTSGDTAGDRLRVVGYAALAFGPSSAR